MDMALRTLEQFRQWLQAQPDGAVVGEPRKYDDCPLARCYSDLSGKRIFVSQIWGVGSDAVDGAALLPFERAFIEGIDAGKRTEISKEQALDILAQVTQEVGT